MGDVSSNDDHHSGSPGDTGEPVEPGALKYPLDEYEIPDFVDAPLTDEERRSLAWLSDAADAAFGDLVFDPAEQFRRASLRIVPD